MRWLYLLSLLFAVLSVLPLIVLVMRTEKSGKKNIRIIHAARYNSLSELEQQIREIWWEAHFDGDASADSVLVVTDSKKSKKVCRKLRTELPSLIIKDEKKLTDFLRNEKNGQEKLHRAQR